MNNINISFYMNLEPFQVAIKQLSKQMNESTQQIQEAALAAAATTPFSLNDELEKLADTFKEIKQLDTKCNHRKKGKQIKTWSKTRFYQR